MFFLSGDPYIRFNLPDRPLFSIVWGGFFIIGLITALVGVFRGQTVWRKTAYFSVIATTLIMLLPTALAVNEITPSNLRAIGMMPLVFVFPALGRMVGDQKDLDADERGRTQTVAVLPRTLALIGLLMLLSHG